MATDMIHLVFSADQCYINYLLIAMDSALRHTRSKCSVYVLSVDFEQPQIDCVNQLAKHHGATAIFPKLIGREYESLPNLLHLSLNTYLRIYSPEVLVNCERLIYLDCDLVVRQGLDELWKTDLGGCPIAAAPMLNAAYGDEFVRRHALPPMHEYFNAGVLLIDAAAWRNYGHGEQIFKWLQTNREGLTFADQDGLNAVFAGQACSLSPAWNCEARLFRELHFPGCFDKSRIMSAIQNPAIIHYSGQVKPWSTTGLCPRRDEYWRHADLVEKVIGRPLVSYPRQERILDRVRATASLLRMQVSHAIRRRVRG